MDAIPSSQPSQSRNTALFSNADGSAINLFADLWAIPQRAKLAKTFRHHGGVISIDPRDAQIILVDSQTAEGRQLIRDWGADANKAVLEYTWVRRSLDAGKPLLSDEQWGGCLTHDDGQPIGMPADAEGEGEIAKSPLPTPRDTPDDPPRPRLTVPSAEPPATMPKSLNGSTSMMPPPNPVSSAVSTPPSTVSTDTLPPPTQMPATAASLPNGMSPFPQVQYPMQMGALMPPQMSQMPLQVQHQMLATMMGSQPGYATFSPQQFGGTPQANAFSLALMDAMMKHGMSGWPGSQLPPGSHTQYAPTEGTSRGPQPSLPSTTPESSILRSTTTDAIADTSPILGLDHAMSRQAGKSASNKKKGKGRERASPATQQWKSPHEFSPEPDFSMGPPPSGKVFSRGGKELCFYVQVDLFNRSATVNAIKKNGGKIVDNQPAADYVILYAASKDQKTYNDLLKAAQVAGKGAIQSKFVHDCVEQNKLLNTTPYLYGPVPKRKRKRSSSAVSAGEDSEDEDAAEARAKEERRLKKNQKEAERRRQKLLGQQSQPKPASQASNPASPASKGSKATTPKSTQKKRTSSTGRGGKGGNAVGPRPPTPPPAHTRQAWASGYKFAPVEDEYALRYAKILLDHDHQISMNAVCTAIHKQMSHHSLGSWKTHFATFTQDFERMRKRAGIAYRKALEQKGPEPPVSSTSAAFDVEDLAPPSPSPDLRGGYLQSRQYQEDLEDDIQTVVQFFVEGNDDDQTKAETEVWARLEEKMRCKTASRWEEFYQHHYDEVLKRFQESTPNPEH